MEPKVGSLKIPAKLTTTSARQTKWKWERRHTLSKSVTGVETPPPTPQKLKAL